MTESEHLLLIMSSLLIVAVFLTRILARGGVPSVLLCSIVGLLVGNGGQYDFVFDDPTLVNHFGQIALAVIVFVGGVHTEINSIKKVILPSSLMASFGVIASALSFGAIFSLLSNFSLAECFLLGAIISSTDAAAIFSVLESKNLKLKDSLDLSLELESGLNDPMALFLVGAVVSFIVKGDVNFSFLAMDFILQIGIGLLAGSFGGYLLNYVIRSKFIDDKSLVVVLVVSWSIVSWFLCQKIGANILIFSYFYGIFLGRNLSKNDFEYIETFLSGISWTCQASLFLILGLQIFPKDLIEFLPEGIAAAFILLLVSRPISVLSSAKKAYYKPQNLCFLTWAGLRGATPIVFSVYAMQNGAAVAGDFINIIFFVVVFSVLIQGSSLGFVAKKLNVVGK